MLMTNWESRGVAALLMFTGILMARGGLLAALVIAIVSVPLAMFPGTWSVIIGLATAVFLIGLFMLIVGLRVLPP